MKTVLTIVLKQYTSQSRAQRYCQKITSEVKSRFNSHYPDLVVNQLDGNVFQVELIFVGVFPKEIDLIGIV